MIPWELCKKCKLDHTTKCYVQKLESLQENETYKVLSDLNIQTDHLIPVRWPDLVIINKQTKKKIKEENLPNPGLYRPSGPQNENLKKSGKSDKYSDLARQTKKKSIGH